MVTVADVLDAHTVVIVIDGGRLAVCCLYLHVCPPPPLFSSSRHCRGITTRQADSPTMHRRRL